MSDKSNFAKQWQWVSGERSGLADKDTMEYAKWDAQDLPSLVLAKKEKDITLWTHLKRLIWLGPALALGVILWLNPPQEQMRTKGAWSLRVFQIGANGEKSNLGTSASLSDGSKVSFEMKVATNSSGYWAITNYKNELVSSELDFFKNKFELQADYLFRFNGALELTPPNQGEKLLLVVCEDKIGFDEANLFAKVSSRDFLRSLNDAGKAEFAGCLFRLIQLREYQ